jgi:LmbE family N-acetylglucosaminyl deacetylase
VRVLAVSGHPDDETMFAGGYLARRASLGDELYILCSTRGEGGEVGDPPVGPRERLGEIREQELRCAAHALGARDVYFLDYLDPYMEIGGTASRIDASLDEYVAAIAGYLERLRPDVVVTHGSNGEYGHPQHVFTHQAVFEAARQLGERGPREIVTWMARRDGDPEVRLTNQDDPADEVLDVSPWFEAKLTAAACHRSQHAMFRRNNQDRELHDLVRRVECFRHWPLR